MLCRLFVLAGLLLVTAAHAQTRADALLSIDQNRVTVIDRIMRDTGDAVMHANAGIDAAQLRDMLTGLRADHLLAASLAGTGEGLRDVLAKAMVSANDAAGRASVATKALGDTVADVTYTPVTPCRLLDTRGLFSPVYAGGAFTTNEVRTYAVQGGNGTCLSQLPAGLNPAALQLQVFGMPTTSGSGDLEILPQGTAFGSTATMVYIASIAFNTVSTSTKVNTTTNQISIQVRGGGANVAIDVVGYFKAPSGTGGQYLKQGGNAFGATAVLGTTDNQPLEVVVNGSRVMRYEPITGPNTGPNIVGGSPSNTVDNASYAQTIAGGGTSGGGCSDPTTGGVRPCANRTGSLGATIAGGINNVATGYISTIAGGAANTASDTYATVGGGSSNIASGFYSTVAGGEGNRAAGLYSFVGAGLTNVASGTASVALGHSANAGADGCFVFSDNVSTSTTNCSTNTFVARATGGVTFITSGTSQSNYNGVYVPAGGGAWVVFSDKHAKDNIRPADVRDTLRKVVDLPISTWNWSAQDTSIRHMGPMAQDFAAAFGLGESPTGINTVDADGVALAAIQGLNAMVVEQQRELRKLRAEIRKIKKAHVQ